MHLPTSPWLTPAHFRASTTISLPPLAPFLPPAAAPPGTRPTHTACTQAEVNAMFDSAKAAQKEWARTPLWQRAQLLKAAAALMREHAQPMANCLIREVGRRRWRDDGEAPSRGR